MVQDGAHSHPGLESRIAALEDFRTLSGQTLVDHAVRIAALEAGSPPGNGNGGNGNGDPPPLSTRMSVFLDPFDERSFLKLPLGTGAILGDLSHPYARSLREDSSGGGLNWSNWASPRADGRRPDARLEQVRIVNSLFQQGVRTWAVWAGGSRTLDLWIPPGAQVSLPDPCLGGASDGHLLTMQRDGTWVELYRAEFCPRDNPTSFSAREAYIIGAASRAWGLASSGSPGGLGAQAGLRKTGARASGMPGGTLHPQHLELGRIESSLAIALGPTQHGPKSGPGWSGYPGRQGTIAQHLAGDARNPVFPSENIDSGAGRSDSNGYNGSPGIPMGTGFAVHESVPMSQLGPDGRLLAENGMVHPFWVAEFASHGPVIYSEPSLGALGAARIAKLIQDWRTIVRFLVPILNTDPGDPDRGAIGGGVPLVPLAGPVNFDA